MTRKIRQTLWSVSLLAIVLLLVSACGSGGGETPAATQADTQATAGNASSDPLRIVATTTQIADLARNVLGERGEVSSILPLNSDAHDFEPTPQDVERVADADLILEHGLGLDTWVEGLIKSAGGSATHVLVTDRVHSHTSLEDEQAHEDDASPDADGTAHTDDDHDAANDEDEDGHDHGDVDPHVWFDVTNAKIMVENIRDALIAADEAGRATYEANASAYIAELDALDAWIREQVATIPEDQRKMVTNHEAFGYFIEAYGFDFVGAVIPSLDSQAQPTARETAELMDKMEHEQVRVIFAEAAINPDLATQLAEELGIDIVDDLYGDSLGSKDSGADTYIGMMRSNTEKIVAALR